MAPAAVLACGPGRRAQGRERTRVERERAFKREQGSRRRGGRRAPRRLSRHGPIERRFQRGRTIGHANPERGRAHGAAQGARGAHQGPGISLWGERDGGCQRGASRDFPFGAPGPSTPARDQARQASDQLALVQVRGHVPGPGGWVLFGGSQVLRRGRGGEHDLRPVRGSVEDATVHQVFTPGSRRSAQPRDVLRRRRGLDGERHATHRRIRRQAMRRGRGRVRRHERDKTRALRRRDESKIARYFLRGARVGERVGDVRAGG